jgi:hypothetical protein
VSVHEWRKRTATGAALSALAIGLQEALENKKKDPPPIVVDADGEPVDEERMLVNLFPGHPELSWVVIRPDN